MVIYYQCVIIQKELENKPFFFKLSKQVYVVHGVG